MLILLFATWLLLSLPMAVLIGRGIARGSRHEEPLVSPYLLALPAQVREPESALQMSA